MITKERFNDYLDVNEKISLFAREYINYYYQLNYPNAPYEIGNFSYSVDVKESIIEVDAWMIDDYGCGEDDYFNFPFSYLFLDVDEWKKQLEIKTLEEKEIYRKQVEKYEKRFNKERRK